MAPLSESLIEWYLLNKRDLPWRNTNNPYFIWLSETILQQTRVSQGLAYYYRFTERFPQIEDLANADIDEVLEIWQGLGYYSRGRNLHFTAKFVVDELHGIFPQNFNDLLKLKGVGQYTAAAISSFAYHEDKGVVDGNVIRVISRLYQIGDDIRSPKTRQVIEKIVEDILPSGNSYLFNQAIMELGALVCLPRNPHCARCPMREYCGSFLNNSQSRFPFKSSSKPRKVRFLNYLLLEKDHRFYFSKRISKDIWEGLYEPWLAESEICHPNPDFILEQAKNKHVIGSGGYQLIKWTPPRKHILSHQELWVSVCHIQIDEFGADLPGKWVPIEGLASLPKPIIFSKILNDNANPELPLILNF